MKNLCYTYDDSSERLLIKENHSISSNNRLTVPERYRNDPIAQVACEFRFVPSTEWDATTSGLLFRELQGRFPTKQPARAFLSPLPPLIEGELVDMTQFISSDGFEIVQVGPNVLSILRNAPYSGWDSFVPVIHEAYQKYREITQPAGLMRIGLRYINRIVFPGPSVTINDYFTFYVHMPQIESLPGMDHFIGLANYFREGGRDILTEQIVAGGQHEGNSVIVLDLDYGLIRPNDVSLDDATPWLENAHNTIKLFFEASITNELREIFEPIPLCL